MKGFPTIDLHEFETIAEALEHLERELFLFVQKGEKYCRVIHGIGTGKMAEAVHAALDENPMIALWEEEESGGSCAVVL